MSDNVNIDVKVIGISGFKGSGKDSIASIIVDRHYENLIDSKKTDYFKRNSLYVYSMADPIRNVIHAVFSEYEPKYNEKELNNERWSKRLKRLYSYRNMMNDIGMMFRRMYGNKLWIWAAEDCLKRCYNNTRLFIDEHNISNHTMLFVIPDIRYKQEIKMLQRFKTKYNASVEHWLVLRNTALPEWAKMGLRVTDPIERKIILKDFKPTTHESEWCLCNPKFSRIITNDGTIDDLKTQIIPIIDSITNN